MAAPQMNDQSRDLLLYLAKYFPDCTLDDVYEMGVIGYGEYTILSGVVATQLSAALERCDRLQDLVESKRSPGLDRRCKGLANRLSNP